MRSAIPHDPYRATALNVPQLVGNEVTTDPVRVLAVVDRYPPWINAGAEWMLHSILRRLAEWGHSCQVVTALPETVRVPANIDGVFVYPYAAMDDLADSADVLVGHLLWTRDVVGLATKHRLPLMYLMHNDQQIAHWSLSSRNVTVMVWNSEWVEAKCSPSWGGPSFVCRPPVFCADYQVDESKADRSRVTLVNPIPEKGAGLFYELARRRHRDKFMAVTGAYGHQHRPPHYIDNAELIPPTSNMREDVYARTRVLLVPSSYESWGRVAVEGMAAGCPVLAHPTAGLLEACGRGAQFADRDDLEVWLGMLAGLDDPETWASWSAAGKARAAELETVTDSDLVEFDLWLRRCATVSRAAVRS